MDDFELLQAYVHQHAEHAFATLVSRHLNLVYSAALRQTGEPHTAEDVTQVVFILLARKAATLCRDVILPGWLLRTTHFTAGDARRRERRRHAAECKLMDHLNLTGAEGNSTWEQIAPLLDEALVKLDAKDRDAIALRFFEQKSFKEIAAAMGLPENTARMRVTRALERLRARFARRGVAVSAGALAAAICAGAVQAAPPGLLAKVTAVATAKGAGATASTAALLKDALELLAWYRVKAAATIAIPLLFLGGAAIYVAPLVGQRILPANTLRNGSFEEGLSGWSGYFDPKSRARASFSAEQNAAANGHAARISVTETAYYNSVELQQAGLAVKAGHQYKVSFRARSSVTQPLRLNIIKNSAPWTFCGFRAITEITPHWQTYRVSGRALVTADDAKLLFQCGDVPGDIWIGQVSFRDCGNNP